MMKERQFVKNRNVHMFLFALTSFLIIGSLFLMNLHTPLLQDDYDYSISWSTGQKLSGIPDIIASQIVHYQIWGGRSITHTLTQLFLYLGKPLFNVLNTAAYLLLLYYILVLSGNALSTFPWKKLLIAHMLLFLTVPFFGTVFLWLDGSCNYLWGTIISLFPFLFLFSKKNKGFFCKTRTLPLAILLSFLSGWTNENTACGIFGALFLFWISDWRKTGKADNALIIILVSQFIGITFMLLAPGNFSRASVYSGSMLSELCLRFIYTVFYYIRYTFPVLILDGTVIIYQLIVSRRHIREIFSIYLMASILSALVIIVSPEISDRTYTGSIILLMIDLFTRWDLRKLFTGKRTLHASVTAILIAALLYKSVAAIRDVKEFEQNWSAQLLQVQQALTEEQDHVVLESIPKHSSYTMGIELAETPEEWPNSTLSKWYGIAIYGTDIVK